jgi:DNA-binding XRE family transcriptional regulator
VQKTFFPKCNIDHAGEEGLKWTIAFTYLERHMRKETNMKDAWLSALGEAICERRLHINMTQQELADLSGVHRTYVSDIERGTRNVTVTTANKISLALEIATSKLFSIADKKVKVLVESRGSQRS